MTPPNPFENGPCPVCGSPSFELVGAALHGQTSWRCLSCETFWNEMFGSPVRRVMRPRKAGR